MQNISSLKLQAFILLAIVLIEGFVTISAEILTIRQLIPFVGSSVVVTSIIIGIFLLFLAYGYRKGGMIKEKHASILARNFIVSALLIGVGLSYFFIHQWFTYAYRLFPAHDMIPLLSYLLLITAPLVYLLGQTVPLTLHLFPGNKEIETGLLGGRIMHVSTLGSFLGAVVTSIVLFALLGVAATVIINTFLLIFLAAFLLKNRRDIVVCSLAFVVIFPATYLLNANVEKSYFLKTNNYANYRVLSLLTQDSLTKHLEINNSYSSMLDSYGQGYPYIETIKRVMFKELALKDANILVLGAGGFSLNHDAQKDNHFVYIDIDPDIKDISEAHFSGPISGEFVAQDARQYLQTTNKRFAAVVVDAYNSPLAIPQHLVTYEYFKDIENVLQPDGVVVLNIIARPDFSDSYSQRIDATIRAALGFCSAQPLQYSSEPSNIVYVCYPNVAANEVLYTDNKNNATLDAFKMKMR
jgi:spermidine synthase